MASRRPDIPYLRLDTDDSDTLNSSSPSKTRLLWLQPYLTWRPLSILFSVILLTITFVIAGLNVWRIPFAFERDPRPAWLDVSPIEPLILRVAIISKADEFDRRAALREAVFLGVKEQDVKMEFKFFIGNPVANVTETTGRLGEEMKVFNDIIQLQDIDDVKNRISEKRFAALKWGGSVPRDTYDYFMTMDSDTFVRFGALARRMPVVFGDDVNPREQNVIVARMRGLDMYWINRVRDDDKDPNHEDQFLRGPWFKYPVGIGYMLSSRLVNTLLEADPSVPHHIQYPYDDVMVGSWIASLKHFHDPHAQFWTLPEFDHARGRPTQPSRRINPKPVLPYPVDVNVVNDWIGWHDYIGRGGREGSFSWSSVCVHHVSAEEIRKFRNMEEISGEWEARPVL